MFPLGVLCQSPPSPPFERWFKFDGNLLNSGSLECTATLTSGSVSYSSSNANTGQSIVPSGARITTTPRYALGTDFYIEFYATLTDDGIYNTIIGSSLTGILIGKTSFGGGKIQVNVYGDLGGGFDSALPWADGLKHKFKITFISGEIKLYVDDILRDTGTTTITNFLYAKSEIVLFYAVGTSGGYYDDLIIHRN